VVSTAAATAVQGWVNARRLRQPRKSTTFATAPTKSRIWGSEKKNTAGARDAVRPKMITPTTIQQTEAFRAPEVDEVKIGSVNGFGEFGIIGTAAAVAGAVHQATGIRTRKTLICSKDLTVARCLPLVSGRRLYRPARCADPMCKAFRTWRRCRSN
jgi:hypothetical protein